MDAREATGVETYVNDEPGDPNPGIIVDADKNRGRALSSDEARALANELMERAAYFERIRPPRVEVLHFRDPDTDCSVQVWVDGVKIQPTREVDLDPGRGYEPEIWEENREQVLSEEASESFREALVKVYDAADHAASKWAL